MSSIVETAPDYDATEQKPTLISGCYFHFFELCVFFDMIRRCETERGKEFLKKREHDAYEQAQKYK